jgi:hypothetical protein
MPKIRNVSVSVSMLMDSVKELVSSKVLSCGWVGDLHVHGEGKDGLGLHLLHHIPKGNAGLTLELDICHHSRIPKSVSLALELRSTLDDKTENVRGGECLSISAGILMLSYPAW